MGMPDRPRWLAVAALVAVGAVIGVGAAAAFAGSRNDEPLPRVTVAVTHTPVTTRTPTATPSPTEPGFDASARSVDEAGSLWVVVNKARPIDPLRYVPGDLVRLDVPGTSATMRKAAAKALAHMYDAASKAGARFLVSTAHRSYAIQDGIYRTYVAQKGRAYADRLSARAGYSEHQTGLAVDIYDPTGCRLTVCYANTKSGRWVAEHAAEYGFVIRYPDGKEQVTGYRFEPWHLRYVGTALAGELRARGIATLEEFFALPAAPDYA